MAQLKPNTVNALFLNPAIGLRDTTGPHPAIYRTGLELPKPTDSVGRHVPLVDPCIDCCVLADREVFPDFLDRQPAIPTTSDLTTVRLAPSTNADLLN